MTTVMAHPWSTFLPAQVNGAWQAEARAIAAAAESRRDRADYNTGSILELEAYMLRAIAEAVRAHVVVEVGTFIGTSTMALASAAYVNHVYTCDASNDCLPSDDVIETFPKQTSTEMFGALLARDVVADLCFFDGALSVGDVELLSGLCHPRTVFVVHDYNYGPKIRKHGVEVVPRKGIGNMRMLQRQWSSHVLVEPIPDTTLAALVPMVLL